MASWEYCGKEDTRVDGPLDHGVPPAARNVKGETKKRNEMLLKKGPKQAVQDGDIPFEKLPQLMKAYQLYAGLQKYEPLPKLENEWHYGESGAGKSKHVREKYKDAYVKTNTKWFDNYMGEDTVIIEEMGPNQIGAHHMKQWADHYEFPAEVKGGIVNIRPKRIIVTSNYSIRECWDKPEDYLPIERRFTQHHYSKLT